LVLSALSTRSRDGADELIALMGRLRDLDITVRDAEARRRQDALQLIRSALTRFKAVETTKQLMELAPEVICELGFDRAMMSAVVDQQWVVQTAYVVGDEEWAGKLVETGQHVPAPLRGPVIPESEIVRRRAPVLVENVQDNPHVHRPMAATALSRGYVAAPIVLHSEVVGFVHGDRYFQRGVTDEFDRDVLATFAEGLSFAVERAVLHSRLEKMRMGLKLLADDSVAPAHGFADAFEASCGEQEMLPRRRSVDTQSADELTERLTRRELEIIRYLASGETNARIASRLVLSEDTVKTHVKHILRKLGAANRAQAVSTWLLANRR
jgi:DNA-binding CsgD family transcriptional regulator